MERKYRLLEGFDVTLVRVLVAWSILIDLSPFREKCGLISLQIDESISAIIRGGPFCSILTRPFRLQS